MAGSVLWTPINWSIASMMVPVLQWLPGCRQPGGRKLYSVLIVQNSTIVVFLYLQYGKGGLAKTTQRRPVTL